MKAHEVFLLYYRYGGKGRWKRIIGPVFTSREDVDKNIAKNATARNNIEYKGVRFVMAEELDADEAPDMLDPRVNLDHPARAT